MKALILLFLTMLLLGCGTPIRFDSSGPDWVGDLSSRVGLGEEAEQKKIRQPKSKKRQVRLERKIVHDIVTPQQPVVPLTPEDKPEWVAKLEEKVEVKKLDKKSRRPAIEVNTDLVGKEEKKVEVPTEVNTDLLPPAKVDIIFIVDSSNSMLHFLRKVKKTFAGFIPALAQLDWRIMFTNADHGDHGFFLVNWASRSGKFMPLEEDGNVLHDKQYLTKDMANAGSIFLDTLRLHDYFEYIESNSGDSSQEKGQCELAPYCQGWNEQPLKALRASFSKNRSVFRPGADVAAVIFSDSDEGEQSDEKDRVKAADVLKAFNQQWGTETENKKLISYGIIMIPGADEECRKYYSSGFLGGEGLFGVELARMAKLTGGKNYSLCDSSYVPLAKQIVSDFPKK